MGTSAPEVLPADLELLQIAQNRQRDLPRVEKRLCDAPHVVRCHGFDALEQLVRGEELAIAASRSRPVEQVRALLGWVGEGRALTQTGRARLVDLRELVELLDTGGLPDRKSVPKGK